MGCMTSRKIHQDSSHPILGFAYVDKEDVASILIKGYFTPRARVARDRIGRRTLSIERLVKKHGNAYNMACPNPDFSNYCQNKHGAWAHVETIDYLLDYLDWNKKDSSDAVPFLFSPIPHCLMQHPFIQKTFKNKMLIRFPIPDIDAIFVVHPIPKEKPIAISSKSHAFWTQQWTTLAEKQQENILEELPHGYILPLFGRINPRTISHVIEARNLVIPSTFEKHSSLSPASTTKTTTKTVGFIGARNPLKKNMRSTSQQLQLSSISPTSSPPPYTE